MDFSKLSLVLRLARPAVCSVSIQPSKDKQLPSTITVTQLELKIPHLAAVLSPPSLDKGNTYFTNICVEKGLFVARIDFRAKCFFVFCV